MNLDPREHARVLLEQHGAETALWTSQLNADNEALGKDRPYWRAVHAAVREQLQKKETTPCR